jgi:ABC-type dipeptide/oligopeptide/nickel transport system permease subunit/outer membrane protein assembly factor BamB
MPNPEQTHKPLSFETGLQEEELIQIPQHRRFNWTLALGLVIVVVIAIAAFIGPDVAPKDPLEENLIIKVGDQWYVPPFPLFTPGYPLGSDQFGRDLWSRLLWAIKPTLIMVVIVAVVRLLLGVIIGLLSGWMNNRFGRFLDNLIEGALSIPVLMVALGAIAAVGSEIGIWAFIIGLSLTGWVETAQQVREQTKIIKGQTYIEAAQALGSTSQQILGGHVLRQIMPMLLMLLAFEVSSTLMTTAGLGFLGYYIGGDVWIEVGDFVARRMSGMPELGQMLATSWASLTEPWAMVAVGSTIFLAILGFNLIGEGLRASLNYVGVRQGLIWRMRDRAVFWLDQHVFHPTGQFLRQPVVRVVTVVVVVGAVFWFGGVQFLWPRVQSMINDIPDGNPSSALAEAIATPTQPPDAESSATPTANENEVVIPEIIPTIAWEYHHSSRFVTGAAFDQANKSFYVGSQNNTLIKFDLDGNLIWEVDLPATPFDGTPAVDSSGNIFVADKAGGLTAFSSEGEQLWQFSSASAPNTVSGLIMTPDETLYYVVSDYTNAFIQAVTTSGEDLGSIQSQASNFRVPLSLSADGRYLFHRNDVIDLTTRQRVDYQTDLDVIRLLGGEDGFNYMISGQNLLQITLEADTLAIGEAGFSWADTTNVGAQTAPRSALVDDNQVARLMFTSPGGTTMFTWQNIENEVLGIVRVRFSDTSIPVEIDTDHVLACGSGRSFSPELLNCGYIDRESENPLWEIDLGSNGPALAGFWHEEVFYFSTGAGVVYALTQMEAAEAVVEPADHSDQDQSAEQPPQVTGIAWRYPLGDEVEIGPYESTEGYAYLATADELVILNPDGTERVRQALDGSWLDIGRDDRFGEIVTPFLVEDAIWVQFTEDLFVRGIDESGEVQWEFLLDNLPDDYPYLIDGIVYVVDAEGILYKIDQSGLVYKFVPQVAQLPASGLTVAEDGSVYYTITNRAQGYIQAVSPDGSELWVSETQTDSFYRDLFLSADGTLLFLKEDIYRTSDGQYIRVEYPFQIDQFIPGMDGNNYVWSDRSVMQWRLGPEGFEVLSTASLAGFFGNQILSSPEFSVNSNSVIWVRQFSRAISNWQSLFLTPEGEILGQYAQDYSGFNYDFDPDAYTFKQCRLEEDALSCGLFEMISGEFTEARRFEGISALGEGYWRAIDHNSLVFLSSEQELFKLDVEQ